MSRFILLSAACLLVAAGSVRAAVDPAVLEAENQRVAVMAQARPSVLAVFESSGQGGGSGVVISADGYALTNYHVVRPCGNAMKCGMPDGNLYDAVIVGIDPTGDIALVKLFGRDDFPHAELGDSDQAQAGDWVFAMGNPFLLAADFQPTVTYGILSGVHRYQFPAGTLLEYADCLQTDASINPGNSGGPLFDAQGRLIGINGRGSFEKRGRVNVGVGYAVSINQIKNFLGCLHSGRVADHATLGATVAFDEEGRVVVSDILEGSDAWRRGLRYDDEIVSFGGRPITTPNGFKNVLGIFPKGWRVPLSFRREGKRYDILVRLAGVHTEADLLDQIAERPRQVPMPIPKPGDKPAPEEPKPGEKPPAPKPPEDGGPAPGPGPAPVPAPGGQPIPIPVPGPGPGGKPIPIPIPVPGGDHPIQVGRPERPMPEVVKQHFEAKRGYANYFYNKLHRERVWKAWAARSDMTALGGTWTLAGPLQSGGRFSFLLSDTAADLDLPGGKVAWTASEAINTSLLPNGSGGLLPAMYLWRRLAVHGLGNFGDVVYYGTAPLAGHEGLVDVLVGTYGGADSRFYFDPADGRLLALEMYPEDNVDPCELYFLDYHDAEGRLLPGRIEARFGDAVFAVFPLDEFHFEKTSHP